MFGKIFAALFAAERNPLQQIAADCSGLHAFARKRIRPCNYFVYKALS